MVDNSIGHFCPDVKTKMGCDGKKNNEGDEDDTDNSNLQKRLRAIFGTLKKFETFCVKHKHCSRKTAGRYWRGQTEPTYSLLHSIAQHTQCDPLWLLTGKTSNHITQLRHPITLPHIGRAAADDSGATLIEFEHDIINDVVADSQVPYGGTVIDTQVGIVEVIGHSMAAALQYTQYRQSGRNKF